MSRSPESLLDRPDRKLLFVGRGFNLSKPIGRQALDLTGLERPKNVLVIPSPANNPKAYKRYIGEPRKVFGELGAKVKVLHGNPTSKTFKDPSAEQIANMVGEADVLWISGGNTTQARELFERTGLGKELLDSTEKVISGGSAGALLQAKQGFSWYTPEHHPELNEWVD
jgi:peptidase E